MSTPLPAPDYTRCPCCNQALERHAWQPWLSSTSAARGVFFWCPAPEGTQGGSGAEGDAA